MCLYSCYVCCRLCFWCNEQMIFFVLSADPCQAVLFLYAHPSMPSGLLSSLPSTL